MITRKQETGMVVIVGVIILLLLIFSSCGSKKTITEYVAVHDTTVVHHRDTLRLVSHTSKTDTIKETTLQYVTIRQDSGRVDTVRVETIRDRYRNIYVHDSIDTYKAAYDSLRAVLRAQESVKETKRTTIPKTWEYGILVFFAFVLYIILSWAASLWKKN